jgi:hypothetical protein
MARISKLVTSEKKEGRAHRSEVECHWSAIQDDRRYLQLDCYRATDRKKPRKVSQTLQFDRDSAEELVTIIRRVFPL